VLDFECVFANQVMTAKLSRPIAYFLEGIQN